MTNKITNSILLAEMMWADSQQPGITRQILLGEKYDMLGILRKNTRTELS